MTSLEQLREACAHLQDAESAHLRESATHAFGAARISLNRWADECDARAAAIRAIDLTQFERGDKQEEK